MAIDRTFCVAPMMEYTDRHFRYLMRIVSRRALLFTEMVTAAAVIHGDRDKLLGFDPFEHPLAAQLGGSDPAQLAQCAQIVEAFGYDEINLNVGCPSERVQAGRFGACLMLEPALVAQCVALMKARVSIPVTVKCRIGVDDQDRYAQLQHFTQQLCAVGVDALYVHARKALLQGLSPKQNRTIPPLNYAVVYQLKQDFPDLPIILNGGVKTLADAQQHITQVDGVMVGREVYANPGAFCAVDQALYADQAAPVNTRREVLAQYLPYLSAQLDQGVALKQISRHLLGLFKGVPGGKKWRRYLSEHAYKPQADIRLIAQAMTALETVR